MGVKRHLWAVHVATTHVFYDPNMSSETQNCLCDQPHDERYYGLNKKVAKRMASSRNNVKRIMPIKQAQWYMQLYERFRQRYVAYAVQELGFLHLVDEDRPVLTMDQTESVPSSALSIASSYLVLPRPYGSILLELSSRDGFLNILVYTLDSRRLARLIAQRLLLSR